MLNSTKAGPAIAAMKSIFARIQKESQTVSCLIMAHRLIALHLQALQGTGNLSTPQAALVFHNPMDRLSVAFRQLKDF